MKHTILLVLFMLAQKLFFAQCTNADFELGNFTGWSGRTGTCCPINLPAAGLVAGRHTITSGPGTDPRTCNVVTVVSPQGGNFSARLGNNLRGSRAEGLSYTYTVTPASTLFIYQYAVVFEDPGHTDDEQPRFETQVIAGGQPIPCTQYVVSAASNLPGFQSCPGIDWQGNPITIVYRNWSTVGVDLSAFIGQSVTLEFKTGDCDLGAHYGYAYIDAIGCQPIDIEVQYCVGDTSAVLTGPPGFEHYLWSTGDTTSTITVNPQMVGFVSLQLTSFSGCIANLNTTIVPADPQVDFSAFPTCYCDNLATGFTNYSTSVHSPIFSYYWQFGDGATSALANPSHNYAQPGEYNVSLTVTTELGCEATLVQPVNVYPCPTISSIFHN